MTARPDIHANYSHKFKVQKPHCYPVGQALVLCMIARLHEQMFGDLGASDRERQRILNAMERYVKALGGSVLQSEDDRFRDIIRGMKAGMVDVTPIIRDADPEMINGKIRQLILRLSKSLDHRAGQEWGWWVDELRQASNYALILNGQDLWLACSEPRPPGAVLH